ncbi:MAG: DDE-type integrase/transposase/recombinase, partial [Candidatus Binataceae bacterium]|nr:DDE-type integrase/transposase/recombinase [Candidatus Binataceae bacterium]
MELRDRGQRTGRKRIARLMRIQGLRARRFAVAQPNTAWVTDMTYLWTAQGWLYLAVILDAWSRRVVGYALGRQIDTRLTLAALRAAVNARHPPRGLLHHSDRGAQGGFFGPSDVRTVRVGRLALIPRG